MEMGKLRKQKHVHFVNQSGEGGAVLHFEQINFRMDSLGIKIIRLVKLQSTQSSIVVISLRQCYVKKWPAVLVHVHTNACALDLLLYFFNTWSFMSERLIFKADRIQNFCYIRVTLKLFLFLDLFVLFFKCLLYIDFIVLPLSETETFIKV